MERERRAREAAWFVPRPPGLTPAGMKLWEAMAAELADAPEGRDKLLRYHALSALDAECVEIMVRVRGMGKTGP
jgi:hypothetical protein